MDPISAFFGGSLIFLGWLMRRWHRAAWEREQIEFVDTPRELRHHQARFRRRTQTSGLIAVIGVLIAVADMPLVWQQAGPVIATLMWCAIVGLCVWIGLLAIGDLATTRAHARANLARLHVQKQELASQLEALHPAVPPAEANKPEAT